MPCIEEYNLIAINANPHTRRPFMKRIILLFATSLLSYPALFAVDGEPIGAYNFRIEIEGIESGAFQEVSGLSGEIDVIEYQDGDDLILRKRPGRAKYGDITLKRGYIGNTPTLEWFESITEGKTTRRTLTITLEDREGVALGSWNLVGCWPKQWKVSGVKTDGMTLVEEIQMVVEEVSFKAAR